MHRMTSAPPKSYYSGQCCCCCCCQALGAAAVIIAFSVVLMSFCTAVVDAVALAPVYWNASNPLFKTSRNNHIIEVNLYDEIDFICPYTPFEFNETKQEFYVVYQVSRQEYENCHIFADRRAHMVVNCSNPLRRKRFTILFEEFQAIPNAAEFVPGSTYYYITTSSGRRDELSSKDLGACFYNNMRLIIRVCCDNSVEDNSLHDAVVRSTSLTKGLYDVITQSTSFTSLPLSTPSARSPADDVIRSSSSSWTLDRRPDGTNGDVASSHPPELGAPSSSCVRSTTARWWTFSYLVVVLLLIVHAFAER